MSKPNHLTNQFRHIRYSNANAVLDHTRIISSAIRSQLSLPIPLERTLSQRDQIVLQLVPKRYKVGSLNVRQIARGYLLHLDSPVNSPNLARAVHQVNVSLEKLRNRGLLKRKRKPTKPLSMHLNLASGSNPQEVKRDLKRLLELGAQPHHLAMYALVKHHKFTLQKLAIHFGVNKQAIHYTFAEAEKGLSGEKVKFRKPGRPLKLHLRREVKNIT